MEITKDFVEKVSNILDYYHQNNKSNDLELEVKFKKTLNEDEFKETMSYYLSFLNLSKLDYVKRLDSFTDTGNRISINNDDVIKEYCNSGVFPKNSIIVNKRPIKEFKPIIFSEIEDIEFKIDLKREAKVKRNDGSIIFYRLKQTYTIPHYKFNGIKYDFSIVKEYNVGELLKEEQSIKYEIEIEVLNNKKIIAKDLIFSVFEMISVILNNDNLMSKSEKAAIFNEYFTFVFPDKNIDESKLKPKLYFIGPQPVTLMKKNITEKRVDNITIQNEYTVTEKADGERMLLYFNSIGKSYLINNRLNIIKINTENKKGIKNSIFDGEYISEIDKFGVFDVYYYDKEIVANKPLIPDRLNIMKNINEKNIFIKNFIYNNDDDIFKSINEIMTKIESGLYEYKTDGIIFTPKSLPVGSNFKNDEYKLQGTWDRVFKWKPSDENTIDFLVNFDKDKVLDNKVLCTLYVGYNPLQWTPITVYKFVTDNLEKNKISYIKRKFVPNGENESISTTYLDIDENENVFALNKDKIVDNSVVEFGYDVENNKWFPLRVRKDKTELLLKSGLSGTANDYGTAINIWQTIKNPITLDMIKGNVKIYKKDLEDDDVYYYRNIPREKYLTINMMNFHNKHIKTVLLEKIINKKKSLSVMDITIGKGGDIGKYIGNNVKKLFGCDIKKDNIENPNDGAYRRFMNIAKQKTNMYDYVFAPLDASKKFDKSYFNNIENNDDKNAISILMGYDKKYEDNKYYKFLDTKFDIIACQFSIHYFFDKEDSLDNFVWNINNFLKPGGYFVGTTMDGESVKNMLKKKNEVSWEIDDRTVWKITKNYKDNDPAVYGKEIYVYIESIGLEIKEYLFDFSTLKKKLDEYNITLLTTKELAKIDMNKSYGDFAEMYNDDINIKLAEEEKKLSFLNMWFIFQKQK